MAMPPPRTLPEGWRSVGHAHRNRILSADDETGGSSFAINPTVPISKYYEVAHRAHAQFHDSCVHANPHNVDETYLMGNRLVRFISTALPRHSQYRSDYPDLIQAKDDVMAERAEAESLIQNIALIIDELEYDRAMVVKAQAQAQRAGGRTAPQQLGQKCWGEDECDGLSGGNMKIGEGEAAQLAEAKKEGGVSVPPGPRGSSSPPPFRRRVQVLRRTRRRRNRRWAENENPNKIERQQKEEDLPSGAEGVGAIGCLSPLSPAPPPSPPLVETSPVSPHKPLPAPILLNSPRHTPRNPPPGSFPIGGGGGRRRVRWSPDVKPGSLEGLDLSVGSGRSVVANPGVEDVGDESEPFLDVGSGGENNGRHIVSDLEEDEHETFLQMTSMEFMADSLDEDNGGTTPLDQAERALDDLGHLTQALSLRVRSCETAEVDDTPTDEEIGDKDPVKKDVSVSASTLDNLDLELGDDQSSEDGGDDTTDISEPLSFVQKVAIENFTSDFNGANDSDANDSWAQEDRGGNLSDAWRGAGAFDGTFESCPSGGRKPIPIDLSSPWLEEAELSSETFDFVAHGFEVGPDGDASGNLGVAKHDLPFKEDPLTSGTEGEDTVLTAPSSSTEYEDAGADAGKHSRGVDRGSVDGSVAERLTYLESKLKRMEGDRSISPVVGAGEMEV